MDAISFVLGVRASNLRGSMLKELINNNARGKGARASVSLVLVRGAAGGQGDDSSASDEMHFMRSITSKGTSEYRVDGRVVTYEAYEAELRKVNVLVKARNFLVFQGDVEGKLRTLDYFFSAHTLIFI